MVMKKYIEKSQMIDNSRFEVVVIGVSEGGLEALTEIFKALPDNFHLPIIVVQHLHPLSDDFMVHHLNENCQLLVKQADEKERISPGVIYIAPPNYHLLVESDRTLSLSADPRENFARPSIDALFDTAAEVYQSKLIGVILTGANSDGSLGLKKIKEFGGTAIVQNPETAKVGTMSRSAISVTDIDYILDLEQISATLVKITKNCEKTNVKE
jgi:two-component system chemotaxis response regulator CheB